MVSVQPKSILRTNCEQTYLNRFNFWWNKKIFFLQSFKIGPESYPVPANAAQLHIEGKYNTKPKICHCFLCSPHPLSSVTSGQTYKAFITLASVGKQIKALR